MPDAAISVSTHPGQIAFTVMPRFGDLERERASEADNRVLRRAVRGVAGNAEPAEHRRQVDDAAAFAASAARPFA